MSASFSRIGYSLLRHQSNDSAQIAPSSTSSTSIHVDPRSLIYYLHIASVLRLLEICFSIISITLYIVYQKRANSVHAVIIISVVLLFISIGSNLIIGLHRATGRWIHVHYRWVSSTSVRRDGRSEREEGGGRRKSIGLPVWDFAIGVALCLMAGPICTIRLNIPWHDQNTRTYVIVAIIFNFLTGLFHFIVLIPAVRHICVAITLTPVSISNYELAEPKSPDIYQDAEEPLEEEPSAAEPVTAESLV